MEEVWRNRNVPVPEPTEAPAADEEKNEGGKGKSFDLEKLMQQLPPEMRGKFKVFGKDDLNKMMKDKPVEDATEAEPAEPNVEREEL